MSNSSRRRFLETTFKLGGSFLLGSFASWRFGDELAALENTLSLSPIKNGRFIGNLNFLGEGDVLLNTKLNSGLDGRYYKDLSTLTPDDLITPNSSFYIRTCYPDKIDPYAPWKIAVKGLVKKPVDIPIEALKIFEEPMGIHLMECSGNTDYGHFGLISSAEWSGVKLIDILEKLEPLPQATRVLVSGFDEYSQESKTSTPGASWIFNFEELKASAAFLATKMNGQPLPKDHGFPVRLMMPGWYGCTCIKWVNEIIFVDDDEPATSQMLEFAGRTNQKGVPELARDYMPAVIDQSAMPVRVEKWYVDGKILYRVVGIIWGGDKPTDALEIRFNSDEEYQTVTDCPLPRTHQTWLMWSHIWQPKSPGKYKIALRINDPTISTRRLDSGHYIRTVEIDQV